MVIDQAERVFAKKASEEGVEKVEAAVNQFEEQQIQKFRELLNRENEVNTALIEETSKS
jgi:hypothetical protein